MEKSKTYLSRQDTRDGLIGGLALASFVLGIMAIFCMGYDWYHPMMPKILFWIAFGSWLIRPNISPFMVILQMLENVSEPKTGRTANVVIQSIFLILMILIVYFENYTLH